MCAIFSKKLRGMHRKEVEAIKSNFENLTKKEKLAQKRSENWSVLFFEIALWAIIILGVIFAGGKI